MGSHPLLLAKMVAFPTQSEHAAPKPRANSPDRASCPAWSRGHPFASAVSCVERSKEGQGAEMAMSCKPSHVGEIVWHPLLLAGEVHSHQQPRLQSGLPGLLRTSSHKTPELSHRTSKQGAGWACHSQGRSRSEVTRLGREVGRGALYTMCTSGLQVQ